jgi:pimeloyl-ACP methyl ester carboxylesterase
VLIGHSMGGVIAQKVAEGGGIAAAVFLTSAPPRGIVSLQRTLLTRSLRYLPAILTGRAFTVNRADAEALTMNRLTPEQRDWAFPQFGPESARAARELGLGVAVNAAAVRCPTLVIGAEHDRITPAPLQRRIAERYGSEYQEAAGHGHLLMLEDGWEGPFKDMMAWVGRTIDGR